MNCPKCGKELIIGSTLCPDCDVFENKDDGTQKRKKRRRLTKQGKIIIGGFSILLLIIIGVVACNLLKSPVVSGIENGNFLSGSVMECINNDYFYTVGDLLCGANKKLDSTEIIDKAVGGEVYSLTECDGNLYYIKNNVLCRYSPKKRVKSDLVKMPSDGRACAVGKSRDEIYFIIDNCTYRYDIGANSFEKKYNYPCVINNGDIFLYKDDGIYKGNIKSGDLTHLCKKSKFEIPAFSVGETVYSIDCEKMSVIAINRNSGEKEVAFQCSEHEKISDVLKLNTDGKNFYFIGSDGIYMRDIKGGEIVPTGKKGFVNTIAVAGEKMYCRDATGKAFICDLAGNVQSEIN